MSYSVVVLGCSWGGLSAMSTLLGALPEDFRLPVIIVQHRSKDSDNLLARLLQYVTPLTVVEAEDKDQIEPGHVYIAPPDYHLMVDGTQIELTVDAPVRFSRPSIDVTFISAAESYGSEVIGVILTGANEDGALGLRRIVDLGGFAIVQTPDTAEVPLMPQAALRSTPGAEVLPIDAIARRLAELSLIRPFGKRRIG